MRRPQLPSKLASSAAETAEQLATHAGLYHAADVLSPPPCPTREAFDESMKALLASGPFAKYEASLQLSQTPFFCGGSPCACDFAIWEMLDQYTKAAAHLGASPPLDALPLCRAFYQRVRALPSLQAYFQSDKYAMGCNASMAHWK